MLIKDTTYINKPVFSFVYWCITLVLAVITIVSFVTHPQQPSPRLYSLFFLLGGLIFLIYLPKLLFALFHLSEDLFYPITKSIYTLFKGKSSGNLLRFTFLSKTGIIFAVVVFISILYGIIWGRFNYGVTKHELSFPNFPAVFNGIKIVHFSDFHVGSFYHNKKQVKRAIQHINKQNADILVFTGDLVNNTAEELKGFSSIFRSLNAKMGKYAVLGNHDYGDYYNWNSLKQKQKNFELIKSFYKETGFKLLLNDADSLKLNDAKIAILGVENWGLPPFKKRGDYARAVEKVRDIPFKILLSHDPTHWTEKITGKTEVALTLSGHTHAMQFGIKIGSFKWSPVKYRYPNWWGLYKKNGQIQFVSRGIGFIGFPGRIGMSPEIAVFTLQRNAAH